MLFSPGDPQRDSFLDQACLAYLEALDAGQAPDPRVWLCQHPELADELTDLADCCEEIANETAPFRAITQGQASPIPHFAPTQPEPADHRRETRSEGGFPDKTPDGYEFLSEIARGGMGVVYRARQYLNTGEGRSYRLVALKMIQAGPLASPEDLQRFRNEVEAVALLNHPHIVPIYESGVTDGQPFFSMKLIEGGSLASRGGSREDQRWAAGVMAKVARAVHYTHQRGILHCDLKPANILLDTGGQPYVTDFGLAMRMGTDAALTQSGDLAGTPAYMAPEQAAGQRDLTTAADIYSLGAILYELLTGRPPFRNQTSLDTLLLVLEKEAPSLREVDPSVDRDLEAICLKCLAKKPSARYGSAEALAEELECWLEGKPTLARPLPTWEHGLRRVKRPAVAALIGLALLLAFGSVGVLTWEWRREAQARRSAEEVAATLALHEGMRLGEQGEIGPALLWMARALQLAPPTSADLSRIARANLAAWRSRLHPLREIWEPESGVIGLWFSPDGRTAVTVTADGIVDFHDALTGQALGALDHRGPVVALAFHPDGRSVATADRDGVVRIWDVEQGKPRLVTFTHPQVLAVAFSADGEVLATGGADDTARLWQVDSGAPVGEPLRHPGKVLAVAFSPDQTLLATGCADGSGRLWKRSDGSLKGLLLKHEGAVETVAFGPDGHTLLTCDGLSAQIWDVDSGKLVTRLKHSDSVRSVAFSPDGSVAATGSLDGTARVWETATGWPVGGALTHEAPVSSVALAAEGGRLLSWERGQAVRVWEVTRQEMPQWLAAEEGPVYAVALSPDSASILSTGAGQTSHLRAAFTGQLLAPPLDHADEILAAAFHPRKLLFLTGSRDGAVRTWTTDLSVQRILQHDAPVRSAVFSPDGSLILAGSGDRKEGGARLWDTETGQLIAEPLTGQGPVWAVAFSPDGGRFATSLGDGIVRVWQTATVEPAGPALIHPARIMALAFSPKGNLLATGGADHRARIWDLKTSQIMGPPMLHTGAVETLAFRPDGQHLATGGRDGCVRLWETTTGQAVGPPLRQGGVVWSLAFGPDGQTLWTGCDDHMTRLWRLPDLELAGDAERLLLRCEVETGMALEQGVARVLSPVAWRQRRQKLEAAGP
jgi:WD40 repeat protein